MGGKTEHQLFDDDQFEEQDDEHTILPIDGIEHASNARKRLEAYWEEKALAEDLKRLDDW
ncbi:hypothetical protein AB833_15400 [Chromatiales bacterium (ex Bugula neritina AB1)]|nr:hypothetical protein AB833_15400 [Chromatiales bacterium (ex Bugula neritina AB1)]